MGNSCPKQNFDDIQFQATYKALAENLKEQSLEMSHEDFELFTELFTKLSDENQSIHAYNIN